MKSARLNLMAYVAPFATWIGLQMVLPSTAESYALRSVATFVVLAIAWRQIWRTRSNVKVNNVSAVGMGLLGGLLVLALWVLPEFSTFYRTWFVWPIGRLPAISTEPSPYDPAVCGWFLTTMKLIGSAFVIAPVEELFFRSFLYRWLQNQNFTEVPRVRFDLAALGWTVFLFTLEHDRPLAAALCGVIYGLLTIRFGLRSAIVAHITTNLLLAVYVILSNRWDFW